MKIIGNQNDKIDNEVSFMGREIIDTEATGQSAIILARWTGAGLFFLLLMVGWAISLAIKKSA